MRLWHYCLIPVLPDKQLKAMRYEIGDMIKQYPNIKNGLVKYANNYSIQYLGSYFYKVCMECQKRKIKCSDNYNLSILYIIDEKITPYELQYTTDEYTKLTYPERNNRYLKQCFYNLQEKYDRGIISREEYKPIYDLYVGRWNNMHTTVEYIDQLEKDKNNLCKNLLAMGVVTDENDTFTSLSNKVLDIQFMIYDGWKKELDIRGLDLPREAIITMFNRLANVKEESETYLVELGENISKLSLSDMSIANDKGWKVYGSLNDE